MASGTAPTDTTISYTLVPPASPAVLEYTANARSIVVTYTLSAL